MVKFLKLLRNLIVAKIIYRQYKIGKGFHAGRGVFFWAKSCLEIGDNFYIGKYSIIETNAKIGNNVIFANHVSLIGRYDHHYQQISFPIRKASQIRHKDYDWKGLKQEIVIGDDVWVGFGVIILSGVTIGEGSIIAAGSLVTKDVIPYSIYAGNPAKFVRNRFDNDEDLDKHKKIIKK